MDSIDGIALSAKLHRADFTILFRVTWNRKVSDLLQKPIHVHCVMVKFSNHRNILTQFAETRTSRQRQRQTRSGRSIGTWKRAWHDTTKQDFHAYM